MPAKRLSPTEKAKRLPANHMDRLPWRIDMRTPIAIELMTEVYRLANDLGGWETLSRQKQIIVAKAAYLQLRTTRHETASLEGKPPEIDAGTHSNQTSLLFGALNKLGLDKQQRPVHRYADIVNSSTASKTS